MVQNLSPLFDKIDRTTIDRYTNYIYTIKPKTKYEGFRRWLFSFCSIHTTWENNIRAYTAIKDLSWLGSSSELCERLRDSRTGLHNHRRKSIYSFYDRFQCAPNRYLFAGRKEWKYTRDKLGSELFGIGLAKVSFAAELINPDSGYICLDRHVLRWLTGSDDLNGKMKLTQYKILERKWKDACRRRNYHPVAARHALWDIGQGKTDMRYWSHVFEK